ncbi:hypothetical protein H0X10_03195 [Candidatus Saccharibacteria bacterium]|nr:hypothetical protein [Candidatus Saccharibacteria bacterium]
MKSILYPESGPLSLESFYSVMGAPQRFSPDMMLKHEIQVKTITPADALTIGYQAVIEGATPGYAEEVGINPLTQTDPILSEFIPMWMEEEANHTRGLLKFLDCVIVEEVDGRQTPGLEFLDGLHQLKVVAAKENPRVNYNFDDTSKYLTSIKDFLSSSVLQTQTGQETMAAIHMTWGMANEWLTWAGYYALRKVADHPVLNKTLPLIQKDEKKHATVYGMQAEIRLQQHPSLRPLVRFLLKKYYSPVGVPVMPETYFGYVAKHLKTANAIGKLAIDEVADSKLIRLPGQKPVQEQAINRALNAYHAFAA